MSFTIPTSEVAICNLALSHLKQRPIVQLDSPSTSNEQLCNLWYHQVRQQVLRAHSWNFASKRTQLTPSTDATPLFGYSHAYLLPSDWIRYLGRYDDLDNIIPGSNADYQIENGYYLFNGSDDESINLRYISDFQTVAKMDALFRSLFALELAIVLAPNFSGSTSQVQTLMELKKDLETKATAIDGQERPPIRVQRSKFIEARRGGTRQVASPYTHFSG